MRKIVWFVVVALLVFGGVTFLKKKKGEVEALPTPAGNVIAVETAMPKSISVEERREFIGRYYSEENPQVSTKVSGYIEKVFVKEGKRVEKGEPLFQVDDGEVRAAIKAQMSQYEAAKRSLEALKVTLRSIESDYEYSKSVYEKNLALFKVGALPKEKLDFSKVAFELKGAKYESTKSAIEAKKSEVEAAGALLDSKRELLKYTLVKSPIDGVVGKIIAKEGDIAMPGKPVVKLFGNKKRIDFTFALEGGEIKEGMKVYVAGREFEVAKTLPDSQRGLSVARVELDGALEFPEESNVALKVVTKSAAGVAVPIGAILESGEKRYIFEHIDGSFVPKEVAVKASNSRFAVVEPAPKREVAVGSSDKLSKLFVMEAVKVENDG